MTRAHPAGRSKVARRPPGRFASFAGDLATSNVGAPSFNRRAVCLALAASPLAACAGAREAEEALAELERESGGRLGVAAFDMRTGRRLNHRADERFAMCSTFKWVLAALILEECDAGRRDLDAQVALSDADLVPYAPVVEKELAQGFMTIRALCEASVGLSDNAAANILLRQIGGPAEFTRRLRTRGDALTRLDRWEIELNENRPGDPRDTTTPSAMTALLERYFATDALAPASKTILEGWMIASPTGRARLRAGLPADWRAGDKTGTSGNGAFNDVAFAAPPGRPLIFISAFIDAPQTTLDAANGVHRQIGARVAAIFG